MRSKNSNFYYQPQLVAGLTTPTHQLDMQYIYIRKKLGCRSCLVSVQQSIKKQLSPMTPKDIHTGSSFSVFTVLKCFCFHFKKGHMRSYMKTLLPGCQYSSEASLNCCNSLRLTSDQKPHGNEESLRRSKQNISSVQSLSRVQLFVAP